MLSEKEIRALNLIKEDISYENYFFKRLDSLKWFIPLKEEGYFSPDKAPYPIPTKQDSTYTIPEWNILSYLERVSMKINVPVNEIYIDELLKIIKDVSNYRDSKGQHIDNHLTWWYFVKILLNIPNEKIPLDIIKLIPIWLTSKFDITLQGSDIATKLLPKFLPDNLTRDDVRKAEKIIEIITTIMPVKLSEERAKLLKKSKEYKFVIDRYWLEEAFKKYSIDIGGKCTDSVIKDFAKKIKKVLKNESDGTFESFYEETDFPLDDVLELLTFMMKSFLTSKAAKDIDTTERILRDFLAEKYLYFPKMALYIIGSNIETYGELFWEILDTSIGNKIFEDDLFFGDELKHLLQNLTDLSDEQKERLKNKIEEGPKNLPENGAEKFINIWKQQRYKALERDTYFRSLYENIKKITGIEAELIPAIGKVDVRWGGGDRSPVTKEDILRKSNSEISKLLSDFKEDREIGFSERPTYSGLSGALKEAVCERPDKFINDLLPFINADYLYVYSILWGVQEAWNSKKLIGWDRLFDFTKKYISQEEFWQDKYKIIGDHWGADHNWVIGMIGALIQDGVKNDSWAFDKELLPVAQEVIFLITNKLKIEEIEEEREEKINEPVTHALNSPLGKVITALIYIALRMARLDDKEGKKRKIKWSNEIRSRYDHLFKEEAVEAYTLFGQYMPNLYYLDKSWVEKHIKNFEGLVNSNERLWASFICGYLYGSKIYSYLYELMKEHYKRAIFYSFKGFNANRRLVEHIASGYLNEVESISDDSSFSMLLKKWDLDQIKDLIGYFWMQRGKTDSNPGEVSRREKIIDFWRWMFSRLKKNELSENDKSILSNLAKLTVFLPEIDDENIDWLMLSAQYVHFDFNSPFFIEYLDVLKDKGDKIKSARYVGKIFLKMLEKFTPSYDQKHIRSIAAYLYDVKDKESKVLADEICNIYGSRGNDFLRDIYEKNKNLKISG